MRKEQIVEMLKEKIADIENSRKDNDVTNIIVTVHLPADVFLKMAYLFVGVHGCS